MRVLLFGVLSLFVTAGTLFGESGGPRTTNVSATSFQSAGRAIRVERFQPTDNRKHPRVLVLHGAGGMIFDGPEMRRVARSLAEHGNTVDLVHYFDRTGTLFARDATMQTHFEEWLGTVRDAVSWAASENPSPVGIYGYSLGAFLAVAAASDNPAVAAVVEHAGGIWNNKTARIGRMPAVLILHGRLDGRVPFEKYSEPLAARLRERSSHVETHVFPNEGHGFTAEAMTEVKERAAHFFQMQLSPAPAAIR